MQKLLRHFGGCGRLQHQGPPIGVTCQLDEYEDVIPAPSFDDPKGEVLVKSIEGMIQWGAGRLSPPSPGNECVLELTDGKQLKLRITWTDGRTAQVIATGAFF